MPADASLIEVWNAAVAQLKAYLTSAVTLAESEPYKDYQYVKGYRAAMESTLKLVQAMKIVPQPQPAPEEVH